MNRNDKGNFIKGHKHSDETKKKMSLAKKGKKSLSPTKFKKGSKPWNTGKKIFLGSENPNWKGGKTGADKLQRLSSEAKQWRISIFERDGYECQVCHLVGVYLEAHHIKSWAQYPEERFNLENGITLCKDCHALTDNYKGKQLAKVTKQ